jgi:hypothetical protein
VQGGGEDRAWDIVFTQEWPFLTQRHQLSYTVPYSFLQGGGQSANGFGDVFLNYRLQALTETDRLPAFAPRVSLILPTGDHRKGLGNNRLGYQFNLPVSKIVSDRWSLHANAGATFFHDIQGRNPVSCNLGASAIYAATRRLNFLLETIGEWKEEVAGGQIERPFEGTLSPGVRYAFNFRSSQMVLGLAAPIGLSRAAPDYSVFFYFSFEHDFGH